ncbi:hypothetical protein RND81_05G073500, partial [Saponaria officinalis]
VLDRLYTKWRQRRLSLTQDVECYLCRDGMEDGGKLFFACPVSALYGALMSEWLGIDVPWNNWQLVKKMQKVSMFKKMVCFGVFNAMVHHVWEFRNKCHLFYYVLSPRCVVQKIQWEVKCRVRLFSNMLHIFDKEWM